jgi:hypothetical protein
MPGPKPPQIVLSEDERVELEHLVRAHTDRSRIGQARAGRPVGRNWLQQHGYRAPGADGRRGRRAVAATLDEMVWYSARGTERGRAAGRCVTTRRRTALDCGAGVQDHRAGLRATEWIGSTHQPMEPPRAGGRDRAARHHRPHLAAPCCAVLEKRPTCSHIACATGSPRPPTRTATPRSLTCVPCTELLPNEPRSASVPSVLTS